MEPQLYVVNSILAYIREPAFSTVKDANLAFLSPLTFLTVFINLTSNNPYCDQTYLDTVRCKCEVAQNISVQLFHLNIFRRTLIMKMVGRYIKCCHKQQNSI